MQYEYSQQMSSKIMLPEPVIVSADYQIKPGELLTYVLEATAAVTITLPSVAEASGKQYAIRNDSDQTVSVVDKETETTLSQNVTALLYCDGREWFVIPAGGATSASSTVTESGAIDPEAAYEVLLNNATPALAMTIARPAVGKKLRIAQIDAGTAGHTVTLTNGTFDGTNNVATFNAQNEELLLEGVAPDRYMILNNVGAVALSAV